MSKHNIISVIDATKSIKGCKAIFIITDMNDMINIMGYIDYISKSEATYDDMIERYHSLDKKAMLIGSYADGGDVGVQYSL